jgi:Mg2+ and Co2+ transporter CorA
MGANFGVRLLVLKDIVNNGQRTKVEEFDDYIYME